jgi:hypothetical protein
MFLSRGNSTSGKGNFMHNGESIVERNPTTPFAKLRFVSTRRSASPRSWGLKHDKHRDLRGGGDVVE